MSGGGTSGTATPFVGRRQESEQVRQCFAKARSGRPRLLFLAGEAGLGKSRLLGELRPAFEREALVLHGRGYEGAANKHPTLKHHSARADVEWAARKECGT